MRSSSRLGSLGGLIVLALVAVHLGVTAGEASADGTFAFVDGTLVCTGAAVGDTATIGGVTYTKRDRDGVIANREEAARTCTSGITNMASLFSGASAFNQDISRWNTSNVTTMADMFFNASAFNQDISRWNTSNVTDMRGMFDDASAFNQPIGGWNVSNVTDMSSMFNDATAFNQPIGGWNVSNVTDMSFMFEGASAFNQPIGGWNVSNVTDMRVMFNSTSAFNQNIGGWNVSNVTDMSLMFVSASAFNQNIGGWNVSNVTDMSFMFFDASAFNQNIGGWTLNSNVNMASMLNSSGLSVACYDATLIGWAALDPAVTGRSLGANGLVRSVASDTARGVLVDGRNWTITDAGAGGTVAGPCVEPAATSAPVAAPSLACLPAVLAAGDLVTCMVSDADPDIDILWRAAYNPVFASAGVRIGADGTGTFSFVVPAAALGEELSVELVEWAAPMSLGVVGGPVPRSVPAGQGRSGLLEAPRSLIVGLMAVALAIASVLALPVGHIGSPGRRLRRGLPVA